MRKGGEERQCGDEIDGDSTKCFTFHAVQTYSGARELYILLIKHTEAKSKQILYISIHFTSDRF